MAFLSEAAVEQALLEQLQGLGYTCISDESIGPDGKHPERESHNEVILKKRFEAAVARLNPGIPPEAQHDAVQKVMQVELPSLLEENRRLHKLDRDANVEVFNAAREVLNPMVEPAEEEGDQ